MLDKVLYFHINSISGEVFYVGIGNIDRPYIKSKRSKFWNNIVKKYGYDIIIEETNLSWEKACELEIYWIKRIGRRDLGLGTLVNLTDGGDGTNNVVLTDQTRQKMSIAQIGKTRLVTDDHKKNLSKSLLGKTKTDSHKNNISKSKSGIPNGKKGYKCTPEQIKRMSESNSGRPWSQKRRDAQNKKIEYDKQTR